MSIFPARRYDDAAAYLADYRDQLDAGLRAVEPDALRAAVAAVGRVIEERRWIYACGNGGSAAIVNHLACDFLKGIQTGTDRRPRVHSLAANLETMLAIANDIAFEEVFAYQLRTLAAPGDLLIAVSASGNSENVVRPLEWARDHGLRTIAFTGFDGGRARGLAEISLHVPAHNYGVVEDAHQALMHMIAQYVRQEHLAPASVGQLRF